MLYDVVIHVWGDSTPEKLKGVSSIVDNLNECEYKLETEEKIITKKSKISIEAIIDIEKGIENKVILPIIIMPKSWEIKFGKNYQKLIDELKYKYNYEIIEVDTPLKGLKDLEALISEIYFKIVDVINNFIIKKELGNYPEEYKYPEKFIIDSSRGQNILHIALLEAVKRLIIRYTVLKKFKHSSTIKTYYAQEINNSKTKFKFFTTILPMKVFFYYPSSLKEKITRGDLRLYKQQNQNIIKVSEKHNFNLNNNNNINNLWKILANTYEKIKVYFNSFLIAPVFYFIYLGLDKDYLKDKICKIEQLLIDLIKNNVKLSLLACSYDICLCFGKMLIDLHEEFGVSLKELNVNQIQDLEIKLLLVELGENNKEFSVCFKNYENFLKNIIKNKVNYEIIFNELSKYRDKINDLISDTENRPKIISINNTNELTYLLGYHLFGKNIEISPRHFVAHAGLNKEVSVIYLEKNKIYIGYIETIEKNNNGNKYITKEKFENILKDIEW